MGLCECVWLQTAVSTACAVVLCGHTSELGVAIRGDKCFCFPPFLLWMENTHCSNVCWKKEKGNSSPTAFLPSPPWQMHPCIQSIGCLGLPMLSTLLEQESYRVLGWGTGIVSELHQNCTGLACVKIHPLYPQIHMFYQAWFDFQGQTQEWAVG